MSGCVKSTRKKYVARNGPAYPANSPGCRGLSKRGNDGFMYTPRPDKNGVYSWKLRKSSPLPSASLRKTPRKSPLRFPPSPQASRKTPKSPLRSPSSPRARKGGAINKVMKKSPRKTPNPRPPIKSPRRSPTNARTKASPPKVARHKSPHRSPTSPAFTTITIRPFLMTNSFSAPVVPSKKKWLPRDAFEAIVEWYVAHVIKPRRLDLTLEKAAYPYMHVRVSSDFVKEHPWNWQKIISDPDEDSITYKGRDYFVSGEGA